MDGFSGKMTAAPFTLDLLDQIPEGVSLEPDLSLIFLLSGSLQAQLNTSICRLRQYDLLILPPYLSHAFSDIAPHTCVLILRLDQDFWGRFYPFASQLGSSFVHIPRDEHNRQYHAVCRHLSRLIFSATVSSQTSVLRQLSDCTNLLALLAEQLQENTDPDLENARIPDLDHRLNQVLQYISAHYRESCSLTQVAAHAGLHPQYFSAFFKKCFHTNFSTFLTQFRISHSLHDLVRTDQSILAVALAHGFNSNKTYSTAFKRIYGMNPAEYRRLRRREPARPSPTQNMEEQLFSFFQQYREDGSAASRTAEADHVVIQVDAENPPFLNQSKNLLHLGRASKLLMADIQQQLGSAAKELSLDYVCIRDIFSSDLVVVYQDHPGMDMVFGWQSLDRVLAVLQALSLKPFIEIGYMPEALASKMHRSDRFNHPNVSFPQSLELWTQLISHLMLHLMDRYGPTEVRSWYFDFWSSANISLPKSLVYWGESRDRFFELFLHTYLAIRAIDPDIRFGSPKFSFPSGLDWYEALFLFCRRHQITPDFISCSLFSVSDKERSDSSGFEQAGLALNQRFPLFARDHLLDSVQELRHLADRHGLSHIPIIADGWNLTFVLRDFIRDTCFMSCYVVDAYLKSLDYVQGLGFSTLTDTADDSFWNDNLFHGSSGLLTHPGIPKPSYFALSFCYRMSKKIIARGGNYVVAAHEQGYHVILYNMTFFDHHFTSSSANIDERFRYSVFESSPHIDFDLLLPVSPGQYTVTCHRINRAEGSSYDEWMKMGAPSKLSPDLLRYLHARSLPSLSFRKVTAGATLALTERVPPHGVVFLDICGAEF